MGNSIVESIKIIENVTGISACTATLTGDSIQLSRDIPLADGIITGEHGLLPLHSPPFADSPLAYYTTKYKENIILYRLSDNLLVFVGPFTSDRILQGMVTELMRREGISVKLKTRLTAYYDSLPLIDVNRHYYLGQMVSAMLSGFTGPDLPAAEGRDAESSRVNIEQDYYATFLKNRLEMFSHPPFFLEQELSHVISDGDMKSAITILKEINTLSRARLSMNSLRSLKNSLICSCTLFTRAAIAGGVTPDDAFTMSDIFINAIEGGETTENLEVMEYEMVRAFIKMVNEINENKYSHPVNQAIRYINKNLAEKISLSSIAEVVYLHPNYLSSLFKKEVGETVSNYILRKRIEEAAHMLRNTEVSTSDISLFYHFCNQSYFIKTFTKFMGCTPQGYRAASGKSILGLGELEVMNV